MSEENENSNVIYFPARQQEVSQEPDLESSDPVSAEPVTKVEFENRVNEAMENIRRVIETRDFDQLIFLSIKDRHVEDISILSLKDPSQLNALVYHLSCMIRECAVGQSEYYCEASEAENST